MSFHVSFMMFVIDYIVVCFKFIWVMTQVLSCLKMMIRDLVFLLPSMNVFMTSILLHKNFNSTLSFVRYM